MIAKMNRQEPINFPLPPPQAQAPVPTLQISENEETVSVLHKTPVPKPEPAPQPPVVELPPPALENLPVGGTFFFTFPFLLFPLRSPFPIFSF